jgi:hypothetical protein
MPAMRLAGPVMPVHDEASARIARMAAIAG